MLYQVFLQNTPYKVSVKVILTLNTENKKHYKIQNTGKQKHN